MTPHPAAADQTAVEVDSLDFCYGSKQSLFHVTMKVPRNRVTAFIGPSGCGKSTLLRCINRMNDRIPEARVTGGSIRIDGVDVTSPCLLYTSPPRRGKARTLPPPCNGTAAPPAH